MVRKVLLAEDDHRAVGEVERGDYRQQERAREVEVVREDEQQHRGDEEGEAYLYHPAAAEAVREPAAEQRAYRAHRVVDAERRAARALGLSELVYPVEGEEGVHAAHHYRAAEDDEAEPTEGAPVVRAARAAALVRARAARAELRHAFVVVEEYRAGDQRER